MELKTPLYDTHVKYNGKIVPFGGFLLPVQYEAGVIKEHMAVELHADFLMYLTWARLQLRVLTLLRTSTTS